MHILLQPGARLWHRSVATESEKAAFQRSSTAAEAPSVRYSQRGAAPSHHCERGEIVEFGRTHYLNCSQVN